MDQDFMLIGPASRAEPITVQLDRVVNSGGSYTHTTLSNRVLASMKPIQIECSDSSAFQDDIQITTANGSVTLACDSVDGASSVTVTMMKTMYEGEVEPEALNPTQYDILNTKIGSLSNLGTFEKNNVVGAINEVRAGFPNAGYHNSIYRGKYLGSYVGTDQWDAIQNGTFNDLFIGDYWTINNVNWRIAAFDYWPNSNHHVVIVPDTNLLADRIHHDEEVSVAYYDSDFRQGNYVYITGRADATNIINIAFGSNHILTYRDVLPYTAPDGYPADRMKTDDCTVELMNEKMVYGTNIFSFAGNGTIVPANHTSCTSQLPLFRLAHNWIFIGEHWWLRDVVSNGHFAHVNQSGYAGHGAHQMSLGIRPVFGIYKAISQSGGE